MNCLSQTISWCAPEAAPLEAAIWDAVPLDAVYVPHALSAATWRAIFAVSDREEAAFSTASLLGLKIGFLGSSYWKVNLNTSLGIIAHLGCHDLVSNVLYSIHIVRNIYWIFGKYSKYYFLNFYLTFSTLFSDWESFSILNCDFLWFYDPIVWINTE